MRVGLILAGLGLGVAGDSAGGEDTLSIYGFEQVLIGDPGNRDTTGQETAWLGDPDGREMGGVDYKFRLAKHELSVEQHFEFVEAYLPYYLEMTGDTLLNSNFSGSSIQLAGGVLVILPGDTPDLPSRMGWEYMARYVNWLHHGKVTNKWAFESGVYDTSTFVQSDDGSWNHQPEHHARARFWIPTLDEWTKGAYWDPEFDNGSGGYWQFPTGSHIEPIPGLLPDQGGERNAGDTDIFPLPIGSFPHISSPWGLLDMAGGYWEYTETATTPDRLHRRWQRGSWYVDDSYGSDISLDRLGIAWSITLFNSSATLRLASGVRHPADLNTDGAVDYFDLSIFLRWFISGDEQADLRLDGLFTVDDIRVFFGLFVSS